MGLRRSGANSQLWIESRSSRREAEGGWGGGRGRRVRRKDWSGSSIQAFPQLNEAEPEV